ncbi:MAG: hypothetical protein GF308_11690 [Candidatus Heimdallarchaeota archaeon]|nr:hypothetical protein [Candidatus Heimdallarchaeota archaeon]
MSEAESLEVGKLICVIDKIADFTKLLPNGPSSDKLIQNIEQELQNCRDSLNTIVRVLQEPRRKVFSQIDKERLFQDREYGFERRFTAPAWYIILAEEIGEVAEAIQGSSTEQLKEELIQSAAVIVAWLETIDREELPLIDLEKYWRNKKEKEMVVG